MKGNTKMKTINESIRKYNSGEVKCEYKDIDNVVDIINSRASYNHPICEVFYDFSEDEVLIDDVVSHNRLIKGWSYRPLHSVFKINWMINICDVTTTEIVKAIENERQKIYSVRLNKDNAYDDDPERDAEKPYVLQKFYITKGTDRTHYSKTRVRIDKDTARAMLRTAGMTLRNLGNSDCHISREENDNTVCVTSIYKI